MLRTPEYDNLACNSVRNGSRKSVGTHAEPADTHPRSERAWRRSPLVLAVLLFSATALMLVAALGSGVALAGAPLGLDAGQSSGVKAPAPGQQGSPHSANVPAACGSMAFDGPSNFTVGTSPNDIAAADFDGDGISDLATVNINDNNVSVLHNTSTGAGNISFAPAVTFTVGSSPRALAVADIDGDGKVDIAVANLGSNTVSVLRNNSTGGNVSFFSAVTFLTGALPIYVTAADIDGDGKVDLATANYTDGNVSVLRNTGNGSGSIFFNGAVHLPSGTNPMAVSVGDLDADGRKDLAVANYGDNDVAVLKNMGSSGTITFTSPITFAVGTGPREVAIGDFDSDGLHDLAVPNGASSNVSVLRNSSTGPGTISFASAANLITEPGPIGITASDLDLDGDLDLATANSSSHNVSVLANSSMSGTVSFDAAANFNTANGPYAVTSADLDSDGKPDLATSNGSSNNVSVLRNICAPAATATSTATETATETATATSTDTSTATSTATETSTATSTATSTPTSPATSTATSTATATGTHTSTATATSTGTSTGTATRTNTVVAISTSTSTATAGAHTATTTSTSTSNPSATACTLKFADVPPVGEGSTFYGFVRCLACRQIVSGYPCGAPGEPCNDDDDPYYRPGANVTRGQLSKIIANSAGLSATPALGQQQFADVAPGSPFYEFVERLAQTGAIAGYPCGGPGVTEPCDGEGRPYFRPNNPATRGQISKIVSIAAEFEEEIPANRQTFTDADQDSPFWLYIERLSSRGVISGYGDAGRCPETGAPCFRYNDNTTRGQMAKIAANAFFPNCQTPARP